MNNLKTLENLGPLWKVVGPRVKKMTTDKSAEKLADYLNRRRRQRLNIPEPVPEGCPPINFNPADCPEKIAKVPLISTGIIGIALGMALGFLIARQELKA